MEQSAFYMYRLGWNLQDNGQTPNASDRGLALIFFPKLCE
jgi:hypothetical protein